MAAPTNTYDSLTDLSLGQVPQVDDPALYTALLDIHNAIESLLKSSDAGAVPANDFVAKFRNNTAVSIDYIVQVTDGTVEVDASAGNILIALHPISEGIGYRYDIKRVDTTFLNKVTLLGDGTELIDGRAAGINISTKSSYTVKANETNTGWNII